MNPQNEFQKILQSLIATVHPMTSYSHVLIISTTTFNIYPPLIIDKIIQASLLLSSDFSFNSTLRLMQRILFGLLKKYSIPLFNSIRTAYKHTTASASAKQETSDDGKKKHPFDQFFSSMMSKTNLSAPPIDESTSLQILNIEKGAQNEELDPKHVLNRYYILFKKNDPQNGGTTYLQSKIFAAKECLMEKYQNASELEHEFYKEVVEPQLRKDNVEEEDSQSSENSSTQKAQKNEEKEGK